MRVVIIDDENLVRIGIRSAIDWKACGCEVVGEAADGVTGLKLIQEKQPDLVFLDIAMPNMDGLELMDELKRLGISCKIVVLSCHDDFDYVRKAMEYGACRYVLKNEIDGEAVIKLLESIRGSRVVSGGERAKGSQCEIICRICEGENVSMQEIEELCGCRDSVIAVSFSIRNYSGVLERYSKNQRETLDSRVLNFCTEWVRTMPDCSVKLFRWKVNRFWMLLLFDGKGSQQEAERILQSLRNVLNNYLNLDIYVGVSSCRVLPGGLSEAVIEAGIAREMFFFRMEPVCLYSRRLDIMSDKGVRAIMFELLDRAFERDGEQVFALSKRLVNICREKAREACFDVAGVHNCILNAMHVLGKRKAFSQCIELTEAEDVEEMLDWLRQQVMQTDSGAKEDHSNKSRLTQETLGFIAAHFTENISLQTIAGALHVNKSHLCRVFSKEMNTSLHEYLNIYRIERAKELIDGGNMRMYDVARRVGFQNTTHFNVTFKKVTSLTPVEYRNPKRT